MNDNLLSVFKAILENLGMKYETLNDAFFLQPFTLSPHSNKDKNLWSSRAKMGSSGVQQPTGCSFKR